MDAMILAAYQRHRKLGKSAGPISRCEVVPNERRVMSEPEELEQVYTRSCQPSVVV